MALRYRLTKSYRLGRVAGWMVRHHLLTYPVEGTTIPAWIAESLHFVWYTRVTHRAQTRRVRQMIREVIADELPRSAYKRST